MSRKEVLFLTSWYPSDENATLGNFVVKHAECSSEVANVTVLYAISSTRVNKVQIDDQTENNVRVICVYYPKKASNIPLFNSIKKVRTYNHALWKGFNYLDVSFDIVHLNVAFPAGLFALKLKRKYNIPIILLEHWTGYLTHTNTYKNASYFVRKLHQRIFKNANKVLVVSDHLGQSLKSHGLVNDYFVYPNVVDKKDFYPLNNKSQSEKLRIVHISSFDDDHKNVSGMLSAISKLKRPYQLNLITETDISIVEAFVINAGIDLNNVSIKSKVSSAEVGEVLRESDVFVLFSNYETFSIVIAEAWMCGIPAVYTKCGGLTEINDESLGKQLAINNQQALVEYFENFGSDNYSSNEISGYAEQFRKENISDKIRIIYDEFC